jgi:hypothetical protein
MEISMSDQAMQIQRWNYAHFQALIEDEDRGTLADRHLSLPPRYTDTNSDTNYGQAAEGSLRIALSEFLSNGWRRNKKFLNESLEAPCRADVELQPQPVNPNSNKDEMLV